jgi:hypothetical protein
LVSICFFISDKSPIYYTLRLDHFQLININRGNELDFSKAVLPLEGGRVNELFDCDTAFDKAGGNSYDFWKVNGTNTTNTTGTILTDNKTEGTGALSFDLGGSASGSQNSIAFYAPMVNLAKYDHASAAYLVLDLYVEDASKINFDNSLISTFYSLGGVNDGDSMRWWINDWKMVGTGLFFLILLPEMPILATRLCRKWEMVP